MEFYMNAFLELSTERRDSGLPIPWGAIDRYAARYDVEGVHYDVFLDVMRAMDRLALEKGRSKGGKAGAVPEEPGKARGAHRAKR